MSVAAIHSLALLKQTLSSIEYQRGSKVLPTNNIPSRYEAKPVANGLYSERSSSCYNVIKKKRMLREGRSKSQLKGCSRQRATIAVSQGDQMKGGGQSNVSLGHCIDHLDSIIQLLKNQKNSNNHEHPQDKTQIIQPVTKDPQTQTKTNASHQPNPKKSHEDSSQKPTTQKRYRTLSHNNPRKDQPQPSKTIQSRQSIILKFNKNRSFQEQNFNNNNDVKPLIAKIINETKRESKTLRLKEIRDRYKHLSKSKSTENYEMVAKVNVQSVVNEGGKRYGKRMMRVCSSGNYQVGLQQRKKNQTAEGRGNRYLRYEFKETQKQSSGQKVKQQNQQPSEPQLSQNPVPSIQSKPPQPLSNNFISPSTPIPIPLPSQPSLLSSPFYLKDINCSKISIKPQSKSHTSFFSQIPSYLQSTKKTIEQKSTFSKKPIKHPQNQDDNVLNLLDIESLEIKKIFKAKEKRKQLQKWKRNFPEGFFQQAKV